MLIIPAIDLRDGQCVRLKQGLMDEATVFSNSPGEQAAHWLEQGARRLHIVDLNGAFAGKQKNERAIKEIVAALGDEIPIQLGGGIRERRFDCHLVFNRKVKDIGSRVCVPGE